MPAVGVLTIGQAPRADGLAGEVEAVLGPDATVVERGALDGLTLDDVSRMQAGPDDYRLVTLMSDGTPVQIGKPPILERLQAQIDRLEHEDGVAGTLLMCTGAFPDFRHTRPLIQPQEALYATTIALAGKGKIAAMIPMVEQCGQAARKWGDMGVRDPVLVVADPYGPDPCNEVSAAARQARDGRAALLFMDCFGYDRGMRDAARQAFHGPVLLARTLAGRFLAEMVT